MHGEGGDGENASIDLDVCDLCQRALIRMTAAFCRGQKEEVESAMLYDTEGRVLSIEEGGEDDGLELRGRLVEMGDDLHRGRSGRSGRAQRGS